MKALEQTEAEVCSIERKKETRYAPLLFNLAELQNECSRRFKISPDETLKITQELYEKKLVTYPRTDARVLSTAVAKEIYKNIRGLGNFQRRQHLQQRFWRKSPGKGSARAVIPMTSRSPITMQSFRPGRDLVLFAVYQWLDSKYMR